MKKHGVPLLSHRSFLPLGAKDGVFSVLEILYRGAKGSVLSALEVFLVVLLLGISAPTLPAQDFQPQPVSEYAEKSGPNTITFLSYPKYYTDSEGKLTPVVTDLVTSKSPDWDFEVTTGIWTLRVRADGTFQAEHAGNAFTYRLSQIGVGRGEAFQPFEWGEPNWKNYQVVGDKIRWYDVFRDVDIIVRYIHDILKVDVIVKSSLMSQIRAEVKKGSLNADDYLTARFDIPNVWITTEAQLGGEKVDIYAERLDLQQPLEFVKDGKVVQRLRPVETHVLDAKGEPIITFDEENSIRSAQTWRLKENAPGVAEMSANLGDLANAPEGDVAIDPSSIFTGEGFYGAGDTYDSYISQQYPTTNYGTNTSTYLDGTSGAEKRIIIGFSHSSTKLADKTILSATIGLYPMAISGSPSNASACAYKVTHNWYMSSVTWTNSGSGGNWSTSGGDYTTNYQSKYVKLPTSVNSGWVEFDVSQTLKSHFLTSVSDLGDKGFLIKTVNAPSASWQFYASENTTSASRPIMIVQYQATDYGVHFPPNWGSTYLSGHMSRAAEDKFKLVRYLDEVATSYLPDFCSYAQTNGCKVFIHSSIGGCAPSDTVSAQAYASHINTLLTGGNSYISNGTIIGIEIGGEEEGKRKWWAPGFTPPISEDMWYGNQVQGASFANYYLAAREIIKNNSTWKKLQIWSGGSPEKHESISYATSPLSNYGNAGEFLVGFINSVTSAAIAANVGKYDFLPDAVGIHSYAAKYSPEYFHYPTFDGNGKRQTLWFERLNELFVLCNERGYIPNFVTTEYGFSPIADWRNKWAPDSACEKSQAVYYLRSCLLNSTLLPRRGIGWETSSYFSHNGGAIISPTDYQDFGFHNPPVSPDLWGTDRAIRHIARGLFSSTVSSPTPALKLSDPYTSVWLSVNQSAYDTGIPNEGYIWCGWETKVNDSTRQKWGAIWRYRRSTTWWVPDSGISKSFIVPGDVRSTMDVTALYRFNISAGCAPIVIDGTTASESLVGGNTNFAIPNVTENPTIIKFN